MEMFDQNAYPEVDSIMRDVDKYDLYKHLVDLQAYGLTVVPPEKMQFGDTFVQRLRDALVRACEKRNGIRIDDYRTSTATWGQTMTKSWDLFEEDDVFAEAAVNPVSLTLVRWLLGQSATLGGQTWIIKGQNDIGVERLHSDAHGVPSGGGLIQHQCNASILATDYNGPEDGPTIFVPGSHHYGRGTHPHEENPETTPYKVVPVIGKAGSLAIWGGGTWHAAAKRTAPGLRLTLVQHYFRTYMRPQMDYEKATPAHLFEQFPELERVIGKALHPFQDTRQADLERAKLMANAGTDPFA